jgi:hypothetical protein
MYKNLKPYILAGFEPTLFCSKCVDADHFTTLPEACFFKRIFEPTEKFVPS